MRRLLIAAASALMALAPGAPATADDAFKAAVIYNITRFTTWPASRFEGPNDAVSLCVEPSERIADALTAMQNRPVGDRRLEVRRTAWPFTGTCHVAYVGVARASPAALQGLTARGVLTVGESPRFSEHGAIGLVTVGRQTRFAINNGVARRCQATLSSRLLSLAIEVR